MIRDFFLPHPQTHKKAHLISWKALIVYILFFVLLRGSVSYLSKVDSGVLGISSNVSKEEVVRLTNQEREKQGLSQLSENSALDQAAMEKAKNMFAEDYWAHYSPSGKDPWGFIMAAGYKFSYAGENLARNFYDSQSVVKAWMASPAHKANMINPHYQDIGVAVAEGTLKGQQTVLIVQEFGRPTEAIAEVPTVQSQPPSVTLEQQQNNLANLNSQVLPSQGKVLIDPYSLTKVFGMSVLGIIFGLIVLDLYILRRRAVVRLTSRHLPHLAFIAFALGALLNSGLGQII